MKGHEGFTRNELDELCECGHTREFHAIGLTKEGTYCFEFNKDNSSCGCKKFKKCSKRVKAE